MHQFSNLHLLINWYGFINDVVLNILNCLLQIYSLSLGGGKGKIDNLYNQQSLELSQTFNIQTNLSKCLTSEHT